MNDINKFLEDETQEERERFQLHEVGTKANLKTLGFILLAFVCLSFFVPVVGWVGIFLCFDYFLFSIYICTKPHSKFWKFGMFKGAVLSEFIDAENRLIMLMEHTHGIPDEMGDWSTVVVCTDKDEDKITFHIRMHDVPGGHAFLYKNADTWAACFGDPDGAEIKQVGTGAYLLTFDLQTQTLKERLEVAYE